MFIKELTRLWWEQNMDLFWKLHNNDLKDGKLYLNRTFTEIKCFLYKLTVDGVSNIGRDIYFKEFDIPNDLDNLPYLEKSKLEEFLSSKEPLLYEPDSVKTFCS